MKGNYNNFLSYSVLDIDFYKVRAKHPGFKASCELRGVAKFPSGWYIWKYPCLLGKWLLLCFMFIVPLGKSWLQTLW